MLFKDSHIGEFGTQGPGAVKTSGLRLQNLGLVLGDRASGSSDLEDTGVEEL